MSAAAGGSAPEERAAGVAGGAGLFRRLRTTPLRDVLRGELTSRLDVALTIERSGLPAELGSVVGEVTRRTRLWRAERIDVARELIAHFQDGLAAGREPAALAEAFGPPAEAARLIRRAKRRARPLWWHAQRRAWQGLGLAVVAYGGLVAWYWQGTPTVRRDYLAELTAPIKAVPMEERAWPEYRAALLEIYPAQRRWGEAFKDFMALKPGDAEWPRFAEEMRALGPALARVREASTKPGLGFLPGPIGADPELERARDPDWKPARQDGPDLDLGLMAVNLNALGPLRLLLYTLSADAMVAAEGADGPRAVADVAAMLRIGRQAAEFPGVIGELVEMACVSRASSRAAWLVDHAPACLSDQDLLTLAHVLGTVRGGGALQVSARARAAEQAAFEDFVQRSFTDDGRGDGVLTAEGVKMLSVVSKFGGEGKPRLTLADAALLPAASFLVMGRRENVERYAAVMAAYERWMAVPPWEQKMLPPVEELAGLPKSGWRLRLSPVVVMLPALSRLADAGYRTTVQRDGVLVAVAAELFKRREGRYPERLEQMVPRYLPAVPVDLFDGKPLRYTVRDGRPLVYSVGHDRVDDGGRGSMGHTGIQPSSAWRFVDQAVAPKMTGDWVLYPEPEVPPEEPEPGAAAG